MGVVLLPLGLINVPHISRVKGSFITFSHLVLTSNMIFSANAHSGEMHDAPPVMWGQPITQFALQLRCHIIQALRIQEVVEHASRSQRPAKKQEEPDHAPRLLSFYCFLLHDVSWLSLLT